MFNTDNYNRDFFIKTPTEHSVTVVVDSTNKDAIRAIVRAYFGDNITKKDLNKDGSYTKVLTINDYEIKADLG
jgi:hypothetical protein